MTASTDRAAELSHREALLIVLGVLLPTFMGSLDQSILANALPTIGRDLGNIHDLPWLITAYLLASTAVIPLFGKIADIHGRRFTLQIALLVYMAGSLGCALAPNMAVLIAGRVLHGIGGGGLSTMGMVVLGDLVAPKERGRYYGYFAITYTTAGGAGPLLGGLIADHLHWSVIFWINIPMGLAALAITTSMLRRLPRYERAHQLDFIGAALMVIASVSFMLALNMRGHAWTSAAVIALLAGSLVFAVLFVLRLLTAREPLIPISILRNAIVRCAVVANACGWGALIGLNVLLPIYLQGPMGLSPTQAGVSLMLFLIGMNTSAGLAGQVLGRVRRYKVLPTIMLSLAIAAVMILAFNTERIGLVGFELLLIAIGAGFGPVPSLTAVAIQNVVERHQFGIAIGTMNFSRNLFATMLIAVFGALVLGGAQGDSLRSAIGAGSQQAAQGFGRVFFAAAASFAMALAAILLMEERPLQAGRDLNAK
jgi:EmrB/QacA subfamily drug resistance transporter